MQTSTICGKNVYKKCSFGSDCFCERFCRKTSYFTRDKYRNEILVPRPDGKCYCGLMREDCPNFLKYGRDCQGFDRVIYKGYISSSGNT